MRQMMGAHPDTPGEWFQFAVTLRATGQLIGDCAAMPRADDPSQCEIGFTIAPGYQGRGYATEAADDDPAPVAQWLPYLAQIAGAKPPLRLPAWLGRLLAGEFVVAQMTTSRRSSNEKARKELGWEPRYPSWREGFRAWVRG
jgi:hypothetical protein